ncbi:hypothetical protein VTO73DRAFT_5853 [Trametes versicolor]
MALSIASRAVVVAFAAVSALALHQNAPRAVSPVILHPNAMTLWFLGSVNTVQWATDGLELTDVNGTVLMGYVQTNGSVFLWKDQPLAVNVPLEDSVVNVRCPFNLPVVARRYVLALLGEEDNVSPAFNVEDAAGNMFPTAAFTPPLTLVTSGNVPSATISITSVIGDIPPQATTMPITPSIGSPSSVMSISAELVPTASSASNNGAREVRINVTAGVTRLVAAGALLFMRGIFI